jgi:signal transduction histidine kinase
VDLLAQLLLRRSELSDKSRSSVAQIREEMRSLMRLVLNLLDINKSDEGALTPELAEVDLVALTAQLVSEFRAQAESNRIHIEITLETQHLRADVDLLRRVLENLIDNAIRHAPANSLVKLRSSSTRSGVLLQVSDEGQAIKAELRERIFERFARLDPSAQQRAGRGLGLQFCKLAVEAHAGKIWVDSAAPGTVFCLELPATEGG